MMCSSNPLLNGDPKVLVLRQPDAACAAAAHAIPDLQKQHCTSAQPVAYKTARPLVVISLYSTIYTYIYSNIVAMYTTYNIQ